MPITDIISQLRSIKEYVESLGFKDVIVKSYDTGKIEIQLNTYQSLMKEKKVYLDPIKGYFYTFDDNTLTATVIKDYKGDYFKLCVNDQPAVRKKYKNSYL